MVTPLPTGPDISRLSQGVASYSERVDAELARFNADWRRSTRRLGIYAVLGAMLVVAIGVWGFRFETNSRNAPVRRATQPPGAAVMVVINPGGNQPRNAP